MPRMIHNDAWLAGIYEGEGNLYLRADGCWQVTISMGDADVIERVAAVAGCGNVTLRPHSRYGKNWKDQRAWRVGKRADIADFLRRIRPYLGERRGADADRFLTWHDSGAPPVVAPGERNRKAAKLREWREAHKP